MGSDPDLYPKSTPKLSFYPLPTLPAEPAGMLTPPLRTAPASVPFLWEEAPGKPRTFPPHSKPTPARGLDLPPRLLTEIRGTTSLPSPTTVLDGPYLARSSSLKDSSPEKGQLGKEKEVGFWSRRVLKVKGKSMVVDIENSSSSISSLDRDGDDARVKITRFKRSGSFLRISNATNHFWATVYHSFKQVVPRRGRKLKKDGLPI